MDNGTTPEVGLDGSEGRSLFLFRTVAVMAVAVAAIGSVGFMLVAGHPPVFLRVLFAIWILSPFALLVLAAMASKGLQSRIKMTLYFVMMFVASISLSVYGYVVLRPHDSTPTGVFVIVPPASLLLVAIVGGITALMASRRSHRENFRGPIEHSH